MCVTLLNNTELKFVNPFNLKSILKINSTAGKCATCINMGTQLSQFHEVFCTIFHDGVNSATVVDELLMLLNRVHPAELNQAIEAMHMKEYCFVDMSE